MGTAPSRVKVTADELRERFNTGKYWDLTLTNELRLFRRENKPARPQAQQANGTRSQVWHYITREGKRLAVVHQYLRPDGMLGGAGRPDPKLLVEDGIMYYCDEHDDES